MEEGSKEGKGSRRGGDGRNEERENIKKYKIGREKEKEKGIRIIRKKRREVKKRA